MTTAVTTARLQALEHLYQHNPSAYRRRVFGMISLGYGYVLLVIVASLAIIVGGATLFLTGTARLTLIDEFFSREGGRIFQKRQVREFRYVTDLVAKRRAAGKRGGDAKARRRKSEVGNQKSEGVAAEGDGAGKPTSVPERVADDLVAPRPTATPAPTGPPLLREAGDEPPAGKTRASPRRGKRLPEDWQPSTKDRDFAAKEGLDHAEIIRTADRFRDYWTAKAGPSAIKRDWAATWRNWVRGDADRRGDGARDAGAVAARPPGRQRDPHRARDRPGVGSVTEAAFRVLAQGGDDPDLSG